MAMRPNTLRWIIFAVTSLGNFISMLNASAINIALYHISKNFDVPVTMAQWVILAYMILLTGLLAFFGRLGDIVNRKKLYMFGFILFGAGSLLAFLSADMTMLIAARLVQAVGGSALVANSFTIVSSVFKGNARGRALGILGAVTHLAAMIAPALSGLLLQYFSWNVIFVPSILVSIVGAVLAYKFIPSSYAKGKANIDTVGTVLLLVCVTSFLLLVAQAPVWSWNGPRTGMCVGATIVSFVLFGAYENGHESPLIRFSLFLKPSFLYANLALGISYLAMYANLIMFPLYAQEILHLSSLKTGLLVFPFSFCYLLTAIVTGTFDPFKRMLTGMVIMTLCLVGFALTGVDDAVLILVVLQGIMGASNALFQPSVNLAILNASPKKDVGMASGVLSLSRNLGIATGGVTAIGIFDVFRRTAEQAGAPKPEAFVAGYHSGLYVGAVFGIVCLGLLLLSRRGHRAENAAVM